MRCAKTFCNLSTLRGFEAAARLASFALAANELHLSHSAVSHQIKLLEAELGQPLFRRVGRSVVLTDAGKDFARSVRDILQRIEDGVARLAPYQKPGGVIVYTTMALRKDSSCREWRNCDWHYRTWICVGYQRT